MRGLFLLALGVVQLACLVRFCRLPFESKIARVPDEGFYYLNLARNFVGSGQWTFDAGISRTASFHPLYAFIASLVAQTTADANTLLAIHGALGFASTFAAAACVLRIAGNDPRAACGALLVFTGGACASCPLMLVEWPLAVASQAMLMLLMLRGDGGPCFAVGAFAVLARIDSIVPVGLSAFGVFTAIHFDARRCALADGPRLRAARLAVGGALSTFLGHGFCLWWMTGSFFQGSARMKAHWAVTQGIAPLRMLGVAWRALPFGWWSTETPAPASLWAGALACGAAILVAWINRRCARFAIPPPLRTGAYGLARSDTVAVWAALVTAVGTYAVYAMDINEPKPWYTAHFIVPLAILLGAASRALFRATHPAVPCGALAVMTAAGFVAAGAPIWPHHGALAAAGAWVRATGRRAVSYRAGIAGYVSDSHVVNLDGLANDDVHPYLLAGTTACYIAATGADVLVESHCRGEPEPAHGIYGRDDLARATRRVHTFGSALAPTPSAACTVAVWELDRAVLRAQCQQAIERPLR
ncbi:hypothetical protein [Pendulispora albinea]|uniref:Mannosyltransferase n=1 Tax=Pendulispora albinea TaxID=2741071 RepID=A0ABZ2LQ21_9BACT